MKPLHNHEQYTRHSGHLSFFRDRLCIFSSTNAYSSHIFYSALLGIQNIERAHKLTHILFWSLFILYFYLSRGVECLPRKWYFERLHILLFILYSNLIHQPNIFNFFICKFEMEHLPCEIQTPHASIWCDTIWSEINLLNIFARSEKEK